MGERLLDRMVFVRSRRVLQRLLTEEGPETVLVLADPELGAEVAVVGGRVGLQSQHGSQTVVDGIGEGVRQLSHMVRQPGPVDQLQPQRHRDRILGQTRRC